MQKSRKMQPTLRGKKNLSIKTDAYQTQMLKTADKEHYSNCIPCVEKNHKKDDNKTKQSKL